MTAIVGRVLVFVALTVAVVTPAASPDQQVSTAPSDMTDLTDFETLDRPSSPNNWLIAPAAAPPALRADAQAPEFDVSATQLAEAWLRLVQQQPRTRIVGVSDDQLQVEAEQRSAVFRFVDSISFRAVSIGANRSTFFAYSRSQLGYWDLGVNRSRLNDWVAALGLVMERGRTD